MVYRVSPSLIRETSDATGHSLVVEVRLAEVGRNLLHARLSNSRATNPRERVVQFGRGISWARIAGGISAAEHVIRGQC